MARFGILALLLCTYLVSAGCATKLKMTVRSQPSGGVLSDDRRVWGYTPYTWVYTLNEYNKKEWNKGNCVNLSGGTVRWASGAETTRDPIRLCPRNTKSQYVTFNRPSNFPGLETDMLFAIEVAKLRALEAQANAAAAAQQLALIQFLFPPPNR